MNQLNMERLSFEFHLIYKSDLISRHQQNFGPKLMGGTWMQRNNSVMDSHNNWQWQQEENIDQAQIIVHK